MIFFVQEETKKYELIRTLISVDVSRATATASSFSITDKKFLSQNTDLTYAWLDFLITHHGFFSTSTYLFVLFFIIGNYNEVSSRKWSRNKYITICRATINYISIILTICKFQHFSSIMQATCTWAHMVLNAHMIAPGRIMLRLTLNHNLKSF